MKKLVFSFIVFLGSFYSCSHTDDTLIDKRISFELVKGSTLRALGAGKIFKVIEEEGVAHLSFSHSTRPYTIHIIDEISRKCVDYLKKTQKEETPLLIDAIGESSEIGKVSELTSEEMQEYNERYVPILGSRNYGDYVADTYDYTEAYNIMFDMVWGHDENFPINYDYAGDGCFARAHWYCEFVSGRGIDVGKLFIEGIDLKAKFFNKCCTSWRWHVVPALAQPYRGGEVNYWILDPVMFEMNVLQKYEFFFRCTDSACGSSGSAFNVSYEFKHWGQYTITGERDPQFKDTYYMLGVMSQLDGCGPLPYPLPRFTCKY